MNKLTTGFRNKLNFNSSLLQPTTFLGTRMKEGGPLDVLFL